MATITKPGLTQIANPNTYVQGPSRLTSLFPVADADLHTIVSGITYETDFCGEDYTQIDFNSFASCIATAAKTFDEGLLFTDSITTSEPLALYSALKCRPGALGGGLAPDYEARAKARLLHGETTYLETALQTWVQAGTNAGLAGDAREVVAGLTNLAGGVVNPTMLMGYSTVVALGSALGNLESLGITVVASPVFGEFVGLVGGINIWGSPIVVNNAPDAISTNYIMAIAERLYQMSVECGYRAFSSVTELS